MIEEENIATNADALNWDDIIKDKASRNSNLLIE